MAARLIQSGTGTGAEAGMTQTPTQGGIDYGALQKYLGVSAAQKGQYGTAWSILNPQKTVSAEEEKAQRGRNNAEKILGQLENYYFSNKLSKGWPYGLIDEIEAKINPNSSYAIYKKISKSARVSLARSAGDVGNLALQEQLAQEGLIPNALYDEDMARKLFGEARTRFGLQPSSYGTQ